VSPTGAGEAEVAVSPVRPEKKASGERYAVARVDDIPEGGRVIVEVAGREIGLFKVGGEVFGLLNRCPHVGGPLCRGQLLNKIIAPEPGNLSLSDDQYLVTCPWHNWQFDVKTGQSYIDPARLRARSIPVVVESGRTLLAEQGGGAAPRLVEGPFRAETVPVVIEADYAVVEMRPARPPAPTAPAGHTSNGAAT
jgi:nitrite reductase/ring-hydroxylating ferredoxin subunit